MIADVFKHLFRVSVFSIYSLAQQYLAKIPISILKFFERHSSSMYMKLIWAQIYYDMNEKDLSFNCFSLVYKSKPPHGNFLDSLFVRSYLNLLIARREWSEVYFLLQNSLLASSILSFVARDIIARTETNANAEFLAEWELLKRRITPEINIVEVKPIQSVATEMKELFPTHDYSFQDPTIFGKSEVPASHSVSVPAQFVARITDCKVVGAFQVLKDGQFVLHEPAAHPKHGLVAGVWRNFCAFKDNPNKAVYFARPTSERKIQSGILFSGRATENFFHWLIEYMPKLLNIQASNLPLDIPLIVKPGLPKQFYEALQMLAPNRELLFIDTNTEVLQVENLWISSVHTYHPDDFSLPYWMGAAISIRHLQFIRETIFQKLGLSPEKKNLPTNAQKIKIYLSRAHSRTVENNGRVTALLKRRGFEIVLPERLSFEQQVRLFHSADVIVGATGAAFSNLLFVNAGAEIVTLVSERNSTWCMKANLAKFAGARHTHLVGPHILPREKFRSEDYYVHSNFKIDLKKLDQLLDLIERRGGQKE